jgi:hypothetical protein
MGTAISRTAILGVAALAVGAGGCGAMSKPASSPNTPGAQAQSPRATAHPSGFAWLRPASAPATWSVGRLSSGAVVRYPVGWRQVAGDAGTATVVLQGPQHVLLGYLNLTPRQGDESMSTWASFRIGHNAREGDRAITRIASANGLQFRNGHGSCVSDAYATDAGNRFTEVACLVQGPRIASVIVGAAPTQMWARISPEIERAISAFTT